MKYKLILMLIVFAAFCSIIFSQNIPEPVIAIRENVQKDQFVSYDFIPTQDVACKETKLVGLLENTDKSKFLYYSNTNPIAYAVGYLVGKDINPGTYYVEDFGSMCITPTNPNRYSFMMDEYKKYRKIVTIYTNELIEITKTTTFIQSGSPITSSVPVQILNEGINVVGINICSGRYLVTGDSNFAVGGPNSNWDRDFRVNIIFKVTGIQHYVCDLYDLDNIYSGTITLQRVDSSTKIGPIYTNGFKLSGTASNIIEPTVINEITVPEAPVIAENGSYKGEISKETGRPKDVAVKGYYRKDGTYVKGHYRSSPKSK